MKPEISTMPDAPWQEATKLWVFGSSRANSPPVLEARLLLQQRSALYNPTVSDDTMFRDGGCREAGGRRREDVKETVLNQHVDAE